MPIQNKESQIKIIVKIAFKLISYKWRHGVPQTGLSFQPGSTMQLQIRDQSVLG